MEVTITLNDEQLQEIAERLAVVVAARAAPTGDRGDDGSAAAPLDPGDVAQAAGLHRDTIYREIARGRLRARRVVGRWRISRADFEAWRAQAPSRRQAPSPRQAAPKSNPRGKTRRGTLRVVLDEQEEM